MNPIECIFIIFVNPTNRLYLRKISDNANKGTRTIDMFGTKNHFFFSLENYLNFTCFKNRNLNILYVDLNIIDDFDFVKGVLINLR